MQKIKTGIGWVSGKVTLQAVEKAIEDAKSGFISEKISLAIVFTSFGISYASLLKAIRSRLGDTPIIGCSNELIISSQGITGHGIAILLVSLPEGARLGVACEKETPEKQSVSSGTSLGNKMTLALGNVPRDFGIFFSDELIKDSFNLIGGMQEQLGSSFPLIGACSSDSLHSIQSHLYFNEEAFKNGACGLLMGGKLSFGIGVKHGWQPLGKPRRVTKSQENIVYQIDGAPAARLYEEYFSFNIAELKKELKRISILYPVGIYIPGEKEYLLRNIIAIGDDDSLVFQGDVPQGSEIRLMIGTKESCLKATQEALEEATKRLMGRNLAFILIFNSISRHMLLGRNAHKELDIIKQETDGNIPIIGIYTYGEVAPLTAVNYRGRPYLHNQTITILAVGG